MVILYLLAFLFSWFAIRMWEEFAREKGLVGKDMLKLKEIFVPEGGGIPIFLSILVFGAIIMKIYPEISYIFVPMTIGFLIGILDDIWKPGGLPWRSKLFLSLFVPLTVLAIVDNYIIDFYFFKIHGILAAIFLFILGLGWTNAINTLAGLNGLEASLSIIILTFLSFFIPYSERVFVFLIIFILLAFLIENFYPARIFPGDSLTYGVGAMIAAITIKNDLFWQSFILLIPYFIDNIWMIKLFKERILGSKKTIPHIFPKLNPDGSLDQTEIPALESNFAIRVIKKIKGRCREYEVVIFISLLEILCGLFLLLL